MTLTDSSGNTYEVSRGKAYPQFFSVTIIDLNTHPAPVSFDWADFAGVEARQPSLWSRFFSWLKSEGRYW